MGGLPDVEESHCISAQYRDPEAGKHVAHLLPGVREMGSVINAADMDENARMKGFGGEAAQRMILQALGKDPKSRPRYADLKVPAMGAAAQPQQESGHWGDSAAFTVEAEPEGAQASVAAAPPAGSKLIRVHGKKGASDAAPDAPAGFQAVRRKAAGSRAAPF